VQVDLPTLVEQFAGEQYRLCGASAALVIGPRARGIATSDSDIDIAFLVPSYDGPEAKDFIVAGHEVGVEWYDLDRFAAWSDYPLLDFKELRLVGRLVCGKPLRVETELPSAIASKCRNALLAPECAGLLFEKIDQMTKKEFLDALDNEEDVLYALQGAVGALATIALYMTPVRFQKPKWVVHDLAATGHDDLLHILAASYGVNGHVGIDRATDIVDGLAEQLEFGLELLRDGGNGSSNELRARIASYNFRGAKGLLASGDGLGAVHTAAVCIRILAAGLSAETVKSGVSPALDWRRRAMRTTVTSICLSEAYQHELRTVIAEAGRAVLENYKSAVNNRLQ